METIKEQALAKRDDQKGFTLMEMLIVVAIIAVLIAIAIPVFTTQLNKAKQAADEANARSIYALAAADYMDNGTYDNTYSGTIAANGTYKITVDNVDQEFTFSDKTTAGSVTTTAGAAPTVSITSNSDTKNFGK